MFIVYPRVRRFTRLMILVITVWEVRSIHADSVTLRGSSIPLRGLEIQAIRAGELYYQDRNNQVNRRSLDEVTALGFDGLPDLDTAEKALADNDFETALQNYLKALVQTESAEENDAREMQQLWLHSRLAKLHNTRDEYVPAAGHAAAAFTIESHASWKTLEPKCEPRQASYAQAVEADQLLREASRVVKDQTLRGALDRMSRIVQPLRVELEKNYNGPPIAQNSTWSGHSRTRIADGTLFANAAKPTTPPDKPAPSQSQPNVIAAEDNTIKNATAAGDEQTSSTNNTDAPAIAPPTNPVITAPVQTTNATAIDRAADEIDALLTEKKFVDALSRCESAGRDVAGRDLARLLAQWGKSLLGVGRPQDAAVLFTQCAVLYPGSASGLECLIETALIYESVYKKPETAHRLLQRAADQAQLQGREQIAQRARELLKK